MASSHIVRGMWSENHKVRRKHHSDRSLTVCRPILTGKVETRPVPVLYVSRVYTCMYVYMCFLGVSSWIVCDGDIDPEWIESLNSVLDDNRLLTMPSGERIQFGPNVNFLFETHDLSCASPATISRMGMIFLRSVSPCQYTVFKCVFILCLIGVIFTSFFPLLISLAMRTLMWVPW